MALSKDAAIKALQIAEHALAAAFAAALLKLVYTRGVGGVLDQVGARIVISLLQRIVLRR